VDFENFYEAPSYLWKTKPLTEQEMEAIMVSDANADRLAVTDRTEQTTPDRRSYQHHVGTLERPAHHTVDPISCRISKTSAFIRYASCFPMKEKETRAKYNGTTVDEKYGG
jgi:hypothetical protein